MPTVRVPIEVDVTYVNKTWFSLRNSKQRSNHYVIGFFQRGNGIAIIKVLADNKPETIEECVLSTAAKGAILYYEENVLPESIKKMYECSTIPIGKHAVGDIHVNNVKNMWRDLKRQIKQTHVSVSKKHLELYCGEVAWRITHNDLSGSEKFNLLISKSVQTAKKGTYKEFIK